MAAIFDLSEHRIDKLFCSEPETKQKRFEFTVQKIVETTVNRTLQMINEGVSDPETIQTAILIEIEHIKLVYGEYGIRF